MASRLTETQRRELDIAVLAAIAAREVLPTYVIRNTLDWPGKPWYRRGLTTSRVLNACRRLERHGHVEEAPSSYAVMLSWRLTPAGRAALEKRDE